MLQYSKQRSSGDFDTEFATTKEKVLKNCLWQICYMYISVDN